VQDSDVTERRTTSNDEFDDAESIDSAFDDDQPTDEECKILRRDTDQLPWAVWYSSLFDIININFSQSMLTSESRIVALIELAERAAYYGVSGPFQNYIQNTYKSPSGLPGALGLGQSTATRFTNFFAFFCYVTPVFGLYSQFFFYSVAMKKSIDMIWKALLWQTRTLAKSRQSFTSPWPTCLAFSYFSPHRCQLPSKAAMPSEAW
jgi:hypothetical protein